MKFSGAFKKIYVLTGDLSYIFWRERRIKKSWRLLFTHLRLKFKQKLFEILGIKRTRETFLGMKMTFPNYGWFCDLWREIFIKEIYYWDIGKENPRIIDAGSNIGMSIYFIKFIYPKAEIIGFEPDPEAFRYLNENIKLNRFENVKVYNVALAKKEGKMKFYQTRGFVASGINSLKPNIGSAPKEIIEVETKKLSQFINKPIDLLKMDVEGAEQEIFEEMKSKLPRIKNIIVEFHQGDSEANDSLSSFLKILEDNRFRYAIVSTTYYHHAFIAAPEKAYAITIVAKRY